MVMIRSRSATLWTIVEKRVSRIFPRKVQHINISVPDRLVGVLGFGYNKVIRKYRIRIDQDVISLTFTSLKLKHYLLRRAVFTT